MSEDLEKKLKATFDNMLEGCQIIDSDWRYLYLNDVAAKQGKRPKEELIGHTMMEMYPGIDKTELFSHMRNCMENKISYSLENEFEFPDHTKGWFELRIEPVPEGIFILSLDITTRKLAEISLRESEEKYKILIENIPDVTWIADQNGNVVFISPHIKNISGFTSEEIYVGGFNMTFGQMHEDDVGRARKSYELLFSKKQKIDDEFRFRNKDGSWAWVHIRSLNTYEKNGVIYAIGLLSDVTEQREARTKIRDLDELKTKFIQIINHQMRTPLTVIRWNLENLISGESGKIDEPVLGNLRMINDTSLEITSRVNDLLTALDIKEGRVTILKRELSLEGLVSSTISEFKKRASIKDIEMSYAPPKEPLPPIEGDPDKLREALHKIIDNALTYIENKGKVDVSLSKADGRIKIEVTDNGVGIPALEQKHIFTLFFRASNASKIKPDSSGVGLSIAKYFIEQHDGTIGFISVEGGGSKFWIDLPIVPAK